MEKNKATLILKDIMEKLSLIKKEELSQEEVAEQIQEEADMSLKLTEEAVNEEVHLEEVKSEEPFKTYAKNKDWTLTLSLRYKP